MHITHITHKTREEIAKLISQGYNKGFALDGEDQHVIWELIIKLDR